MLQFYWSLGRDIIAMDAENAYGSGFYSRLSEDLKNRIPAAKCFSLTNLRYMKRFYELTDCVAGILPQAGADSNLPILPQVREELFRIPWRHIKLLIDKCKYEPEKVLFYTWFASRLGWK